MAVKRAKCDRCHQIRDLPNSLINVDEYKGIFHYDFFEMEVCTECLGAIFEKFTRRKLNDHLNPIDNDAILIIQTREDIAKAWVAEKETNDRGEVGVWITIGNMNRLLPLYHYFEFIRRKDDRVDMDALAIEMIHDINHSRKLRNTIRGAIENE